MLSLPTVSIVCVATKGVEASLKALLYSSKDIQFNTVKLVSPYDPGCPGNIIWEYIDPFSHVDEWCKYIFYNLWKHVDTDYCILIHDDGFIVNPQSWTNEFLNYDYIGAPWPIIPPFYTNKHNGQVYRVGNSVSLRSRKIMKLPTELDLPWVRLDVTPTYPGNFNEDVMIGVYWRHLFEEHGCKYPSVELAAQFSRETELIENEHITEPFCFHKHNGRNGIYPRF